VRPGAIRKPDPSLDAKCCDPPPTTGVESALMVMLKRGWKWFLALSTISVLLARVREAWAELTHTDAEIEAMTQPPDPDDAEKELKSAVAAAQGTEQAPPPQQSMPMRYRQVHAWQQPEEFWHPSWSGRAARLNVITNFPPAAAA
jgi:uncharacterized membrane protein